MRKLPALVAFVSACAPVDPADETPDARWLGARRAPPDPARVSTFDVGHFGIDATALPERVDWRDVGGASFVTPVKNQGPYANCVAFSGTAALESALAVQDGLTGLDLSEQWLVSTCGPVDPEVGYYTTRIGEDLVTHGSVDEARDPYVGGAAACPGGVAPRADAALTGTWQVVGSQVKVALQASPLLVEFDVYDDFYGYDGGVYRVADGAVQDGSHAVLLVGYDDVEQAWIAKNSWGTGWGEGGYFRIAYDDATAGFAQYAMLFETAAGDPTRGARLLGDAVDGPVDDGDGPVDDTLTPEDPPADTGSGDTGEVLEEIPPPPTLVPPGEDDVRPAVAQMNCDTAPGASAAALVAGLALAARRRRIRS